MVVKVTTDIELLNEYDIPESYAGQLIDVDEAEPAIFDEIFYQEKEWGFMFPKHLISTDLTPEVNITGEARNNNISTKPS